MVTAYEETIQHFSRTIRLTQNLCPSLGSSNLVRPQFHRWSRRSGTCIVFWYLWDHAKRNVNCCQYDTWQCHSSLYTPTTKLWYDSWTKRHKATFWRWFSYSSQPTDKVACDFWTKLVYRRIALPRNGAPLTSRLKTLKEPSTRTAKQQGSRCC